MTTVESMEKWNYTADIMAACSCDWGCPCNFNAPPTRGLCEGGWALKIAKGRCGNVALDGLGFAFYARWPRAIHEGGGTAKVWIDARGSDDQRRALDRIVRGQLGGKPWPIFAPTIETWLETSFVPLEWRLDGARSQLKLGEDVRLTMAPMRNPMTGVEVPAMIALPEGLVCKQLNMAASETFSVIAPGLRYAWPGKMAWHGSTEHGS